MIAGVERAPELAARSDAGTPPPLRVAMVLYGDVTHDSRVQREALALADVGHEVVVYCLPPARGSVPTLGGVTVVPIPAPIRGAVPGAPRGRASSRVGRAVASASWMGGYVANIIAWGRRVRRIAEQEDVDVWHLQDFVSMLAARSWIGERPFIYDIHELQLEQPGAWGHLPGPGRWLVAAVERWGMRRAAAVITVNPWIAGELRKRYGVDDIVVLHNCPPRWRPPAQPIDHVRTTLGIRSSEALILYHGLLTAARGLAVILEALPHITVVDAHAVFMGYGEMHDELLEAAADPRFGGRVHVLDAVPPSALIEWVASADAAVMPIQADTLNSYLSTPNKLFEAIAAGVPVVASDFPAMSAIVLDETSGPIGTVCDPSDPVDLARAIDQIIGLPAREQEALRRRCQAAAERWNWETESQALLQAYERIGQRSF